MKTLAKLALAASLATGGLGLTATAASADIVCNIDHECWHVRDHYDYRPEWGLVIHPDEWRWDQDRDYDRSVRWRWREHDGRGYWRHGVWIHF